jgi:oxygen-independent coproporphyrinogen-3 oxidase
MMLYLHIPFCLAKCSYCDFNSRAGRLALLPEYLKVLEREMEVWEPALAGQRVTSMYLGGGTPSLLNTDQIDRLLCKARNCYSIAEDAEITVEVNPATWNAASMCEAVARGVTRLSLGLQSLQDPLLRTLGRAHDADAARSSVAQAAASGCASISVDLIYGIPGQSPDDWLEDIRELMETGIGHFSLYALTPESGTPLYEALSRAELVLPGDDATAHMYLEVCRILEREGFEHYEISNFALPGQQCLHNRGYWRREPYLGLGAGAHSFRGRLRWMGESDLDAYCRQGPGAAFRYATEVLHPSDQAMEELMLGLRTSAGVPRARVPGDAIRLLCKMSAEGLAHLDAGSIRLSDRGMLVANEIICSLAS